MRFKRKIYPVVLCCSEVLENVRHNVHYMSNLQSIRVYGGPDIKTLDKLIHTHIPTGASSMHLASRLVA